MAGMIEHESALENSKRSVTAYRDDRLPRHIAIIMDGNGRWASQRFLPRTAGHKAGIAAVNKTVEYCTKIGIQVLTLFAFSSENWRRPAHEVSMLMDLFIATLEKETAKLHSNGIRLHLVGDTSAFSERLQAKIAEAEDLTKDNTGLRLCIAANYGGRWDVLQAFRKIAQQVEEKELNAAEIDTRLIERHLCFAGLPEPDLFIRTGGEQRISNFILWQIAYTELYFTPLLWPDFDQRALESALQDYASRQRRFGYTGEQIEAKERGMSKCAR